MRDWLQRGLAMMALAGVLVASNVHVAAVQGVAWVRMYEQYRVGYAPVMALEAALSGQAPCHLCKFVQKAEKTQQKFNAMLAWTAKVLLPAEAGGPRMAPPGLSQMRLAETGWAPDMAGAPPEVPPPRWA
jgi:hypothetical protein